ncbi:methyl-accepting chemotaxis protein [Bosea sp. (in: a-proteobacteria)]|uniref:methyl-accepting chemotaxis protein n=1 Tax=Bosea sp. (in: a-proteobacteria) TaxID=1871050 RepID=UPI0027334EE5|nr:methyl-accepting chemotaxis protein [Bosea sp. (in: a-proteobacteria)]MDP3408040.1 methyl-accepting chemotaxis protein [Bosea sp. (in: a-proteobacteria)]
MTKANKPARQRTPARFGIAARIYAAVGLMTGLTMVASAVGWLSFGQVDQTVQDMAGKKMPMVELALELSQAATQSTALAPRFMDVENVQQRALLTNELDRIEARQFDLIRRIATLSGLDMKATQGSVDELSRTINEINDLTGTRMRNAAAMAALLENLSKSGRVFSGVVGSEADEARFNVTMGIESIKGLSGEALDGAMKTLNDRDFPIYDFARKLEVQVNELMGMLRETSQTPDKARLDIARERFKATATRVRMELQAAENVAPNPFRNQVVEGVIAIGEGRNGIVEMRDRDLTTLAEIAATLKTVDSAAVKLRAQVDKLVTTARSESIAASTSTATLINQSEAWLGAIGIGSLLIALSLSLLYVRPAIIGRLNRLWAATRAIADGALETVVDTKGNDEISDISKSVLLFRDNAVALRAAEAAKIEDDAAALQQRREMMAELGAAFGEVVAAAAAGDFSRRVQANFADAELNALAGSVNALLETVQGGLSETCDVLAELSAGHLSTRIEGLYQGAFAELKNGTNALAHEFESTLAKLSETVAAVRSATSEILDGVTDLAERTSEESNAVSMATNQLGAFAGTVKKTASEAAQATGMAEGAESQAQQGEKVVASALEAMQRIRTSSNKISEVIAMIDEIAFQTNLLALNAAVEAARAGDSGRGFAVVATEVRSLAKRSADASNDVKKLVEAAHGDVKVGVGLVEETAQMFEAIVSSVNDLTGLMNGISQTAKSQASDVSSINAEIDGIGTMAHQNAALVEETNAALALTDEQTRALSEHIARFRFREGHGSDKGHDIAAAA